ncbi:hypothetical protein CA606_15820 [Caulobacter vibrioides]|uniref:Uncharacterized protein n=1 Tax=Caulobacter vibrioides TaxID=155892 RepID=A0A290N260_CAUVI|nr:hypothetical protein [Caulobacter vibrioides]ATC33683.1 hypothetical protein CA606_15820 [Caulobacter vibrioides]
MRVGTSTPSTWVALKMAQQTLVQAASHASQPTAKPVTAPDRIERGPAPRPLMAGRLDIRA